ncbi:MAG: Ig-like domain-containing protein [Ideonella sp.]|nr:Ig-like domain-containing protein [Ideonella sp.]
MIKTLHRYSPTATALAAALMLAACGGGDAEAPPTPVPPADTTPPTVAITDNVSEATATGDVTFTFTFSESVGTSFTSDDVAVTGGTKGAFTAVSTTQATLVVTPTANMAGNVEVSVAAGSFADAANNANTAVASAAQAYNTVPPVVAYITFDESPDAIQGLGVYGAGTTAAVEDGPEGGNGKALKIVKPAGPDAWGGAFFTVPKVPFTDAKKAITARVYSSVANSVVHLKVEVPGGASVEVAGTPTGDANTWSTVTWNFSTADLAADYTILAVTPDRTRVTDGAMYHFDTLDVVDTPPPVSGATLLTNFDEATPPAVTEFGGAAYAIEDAPAGGNGKALRLTRDGGEVYAGAFVSIPAIPNNAGAQTVSARVYSPVAGIPMVAKAEYGDNQGTGDVAANQAVVVGWQTLTWTFSNLTAPNVYNRFTMLPQLGTVGSGQSFYFDDISVEAAAQPPVPPVGTTLTFSTGFTSNVLTAQGGLVASAGGSDLDGFNCNGDPAWCGSGAGGVGADSFMYFYYQTPNPAAALYSQVEVFAPGVTGFNPSADTGGVTLTDQTKVNFTFNPNPEWFNSANNKFAVVLTLGKRYAIDGGCRLQLHGVKTPTSADATAYSMNLRTDFRVAADCGTGIAPTDVAAALAASPVISSVKFLGAAGGSAILGRNDVASGANLSVLAGAVYPTTVALKGGITFD